MTSGDPVAIADAARQSALHPGFSAGKQNVWDAHARVWQHLRDVRNREGDPLSDTERLIYADNERELRMRSFFTGVALWITIGAPLIWGILYALLVMLLSSSYRT